MMTAIVDAERVREITTWIERQAGTMNVPVTVYSNGIRLNGDWLHVPVAVDSVEGDAYDRAVVLQQIEDAWNDDNLLADVNLFLVPAKHGPAVTNAREEKAGELVDRQRQLLERMELADLTSGNVQRFQAIRQEWEETVNELGHLFPSANGESANHAA